MTEWIAKRTVSIAAIISIAFWMGYLGYIAYQTIFPLEIAKFYEVRIPDKIYQAKDMVRYEVEMEKYSYHDADVTRIIRCRSGAFYQIVPDSKGTTDAGPIRIARPTLIIPDQVVGPDECYLDTTFTYNNINAYHAPIKYKKNSNWFKVQ